MITINAPAGLISDENLEAIGHANPGWQIERDARGGLVVSPTSSGDGAKSTEAVLQLGAHAKRVGGKVFDSSTGFTMPDGSVLSPDASWLDSDQLREADRNATFWRVVPAVVVEVRSQSDRWAETTAKIDRYHDLGARYAVAIDPQTRDVYERGSAQTGLALDFDAIIDA